MNINTQDSIDVDEIDVDDYIPADTATAPTTTTKPSQDDDDDDVMAAEVPVKVEEAVVEDEELAVNKSAAGEPPMTTDDDDDNDNDMKGVGAPVQHEPTCFTDERGNLKFVNLVVRNPCLVFWFIFLLCIGITVVLFMVVFAEGNPFSDPSNEFDLNDVRSIQYDSLRLAHDVVNEQLDASTTTQTKKQSETADLTYWVYEAETPAGVFATSDSIQAMKNAFDIFLQDPEFQNYCLYKYPQSRDFTTSTTSSSSSDADADDSSTSNTTNDNSTMMMMMMTEAPTTTTTEGDEEIAEDGTTTRSLQQGNNDEPTCDTPLTPLIMYYPSSYDPVKVAHVIDELKDPKKVATFNALSLCFIRGLYCDLLLIPQNATTYSQEDVDYTLALAWNLTSITRYWDMKGPQVENITQVTELASYLLQVDIFKGLVDFGFDKGFSIDNPVSLYSRGILFWGGPLTDRGNLTAEEKEEADENDDEQRKDYIIDNHLDNMNDQASDDKHPTVNSYYFMVALIVDVILEIVQQDAMKAIASLVFVFLWLFINTGSWFLAGVGIFEIFFSIPVAWFIFNVVFQINYFATLNALSIFIVAAIGADDIFIFMDAYKQSKYRNPGNLVDMETRMTWVYRRTGTAMAITSATTCSAFLCTLITPLTSIQSFGIFAAVVIFIDYVLVMTLFCTAVVIYHDRYEDRGCCGCCCTNCTKTDPPPTQAALTHMESGEHDENVKGDYVIAAWQLSKIEATKEAEQFLDEDHPLQKSVSIINNEFPTADEDLGLKVYFAYGLGEVDRAGVNLLLDPENYGQPVFSENFEFNEQCQTEMVKWCDKLRTDSQYEGFVKKKGGVGQVYCFIEELAAYRIKGDLADCDYVTRGEWKAEEGWQVPPSEFGQYMDGFLRETSCYDDTETIIVRYANELGWNGNTMRYAAIALEDDVLDPFSQSAENVARTQYDEYVKIAEEMDRDLSQYCTGPVIMTDLETKFVFMNNQSIYVTTAVQSSILGVCIAFVVLLISTRVFHIAFFASLSIISVLVSVTGTMVMLGWDLGSIESILIGIIAGFSVDYVVHLAHAYEIASGDTYERLTEAFGDMGISVLNGMVTSVAASIPLFFCQLQFFAKFGTFLCLTIAFSWIFANFVFMSVLAQLKIPIAKSGCRL
ncbi:dispatched homolog 1 [Seminavis robusta]|uniref:Dispatched homolog 1 n=1 Tax=Seminavis robusta TaxID=568900 RepID=A0A9N8EM88_9STRA|nr:dispatched homolog 1 [Seminavis robusta]|eukprot:Sro1213_g253000.1 dispatched homolog 1 (1147) ;mRNA; f:21368-24999